MNIHDHHLKEMGGRCVIKAQIYVGGWGKTGSAMRFEDMALGS